MSYEWFRVEVSDSDGQIVSIETESLSGREIGKKERRVILTSIAHLCGFVGIQEPKEIHKEFWG